ncbi:MAG: hypothetical protein P4L44_12450 [Oryzomonas sp.]|uniref:hypothetical protein n=1 Tax=Oryzomonas sp. TaxID=2855186 RepID=UPI00284B7042|nr:hypothetical protein [Oryzomonas sp.]MDR3580762.1 hypothetical protein [Oryzomonas sp.]
MSKVSELKRVKSTCKVTGAQSAELKALAEMPDEQIDLSDIPEITDWSGAVAGKYNRDDRIEIIENTAEARSQFGENYGAFEFKLTHEQVEGLLAGKVVAVDISGREYTGFLSLKK